MKKLFSFMVVFYGVLVAITMVMLLLMLTFAPDTFVEVMKCFT